MYPHMEAELYREYKQLHKQGLNEEVELKNLLRDARTHAMIRQSRFARSEYLRDPPGQKSRDLAEMVLSLKKALVQCSCSAF